MSLEREEFLRALAADEDDEALRLVYADWLEERGEAEEAARQRAWPEAKRWLVAFAAAEDRFDVEEYGELTYARLIEIGRRAHREAGEDGWPSFWIGPRESLGGRLVAEADAFWTNWSIVTGVPRPPGADRSSYSCAC